MNDIKRYIRLEIAWIFGNLAIGDQDVINLLIFGKNQSNLKSDSNYFERFINYIESSFMDLDLQMMD